MIHAYGKQERAGGAFNIFGPDGRVLAAVVGRDEGFAVAEINLAATDEARATFGRATAPARHL